MICRLNEAAPGGRSNQTWGQADPRLPEKTSADALLVSDNTGFITMIQLGLGLGGYPGGLHPRPSSRILPSSGAVTILETGQIFPPSLQTLALRGSEYRPVPAGGSLARAYRRDLAVTGSVQMFNELDKPVLSD